jgi:hypothetical protein
LKEEGTEGEMDEEFGVGRKGKVIGSSNAQSLSCWLSLLYLLSSLV